GLAPTSSRWPNTRLARYVEPATSRGYARCPSQASHSCGAPRSAPWSSVRPATGSGAERLCPSATSLTLGDSSSQGVCRRGSLPAPRFVGAGTRTHDRAGCLGGAVVGAAQRSSALFEV